MKSRLAIGLMLVAGFVVSGTGGALAISGSSGKVSAAQAQYCPPGSTNPDYCQCPPGSTNPDYCQPSCPTGSTNPDYCQSCPPGSANPDYCPDYTEQPDTAGPSVRGETQSNPKSHKDPTPSGTKAAEAEGTPAPAVQAAAQTSSDAKGDLPFTGFAAIPVILVGFALVLAGAFLRRESRRNLG